MTAPTRSCTSCETPIPDEAMFCPACGEATPTEINRETGEVSTPPLSDANELEYRQRLQRALGEGYELRELIGQGGFGAVYAVWDTKLERDVAVKALRHDLFPSPDLLERFQREAKAVARLRHPNILPIHFIGEGEGIAFMVMPKVEGESLRAALDRERQLSVDEATRITIEAAGALQVAHDAGIIHRDVKPENILLEGKERRVLVMDFGIAKVADSTGTALTGTGSIVGTPHYMSPEQASGQRDIDSRSDIYALGCVLYETLAGDPPFTGSNTQAIIARHITESPPSLSVIRPSTPQHIIDVLANALAKVPAERYSSAAKLGLALTQVAAEIGTPVPKEHSGGHRLLYMAVGAVLLSVAAVATVTVMQDEAPDAEDGRREQASVIYNQRYAYERQGEYREARAMICDALGIFPENAAPFPENADGWPVPPECSITRISSDINIASAMEAIFAALRILGFEVQQFASTPYHHGRATGPDGAGDEVRFTLGKHAPNTLTVGVFADSSQHQHSIDEALHSALSVTGSLLYGYAGPFELQHVVAVSETPTVEITLFIDSVPIREALQHFAVDGVRAFVLDPEIEDLHVIANFTNQAWEVALRNLLATNGLRAEEEVEGSGMVKIKRW